ncbi:hypothetical protein ACJQWK_06977 [Exserohilum turcicum]|uniref:Uncharacterized protein n=1 Tax=Exserohilum turcicum (strain 28A) TaxID=671987 RepID=R0K9D2_EXST2|nr:uncharacterized protein SETTUDRAFT_32127 [Exserohilum turcica Et28A]EOA84887.1 hypothetical protein SETTUDRAFT_32127 [Exserohilum turcica Et28A]
MVTLPNPSPIFQSTHSFSTEAKRSLETESTLPGIKRGIAIGVACSVSVVLIAILAFCAIKRRNRVLAGEQQQPSTPKAEDVEAQPEAQEKTWWTKARPPSPPPAIALPPQPPVEVDAHIIYELDAGYTPELHGDTCPQEVEACDENHGAPEVAEDPHWQKPKQWPGENIASKPDPKISDDAVTR